MSGKSLRYQIHQTVLDEVVRPYSRRMIENGASERWSETALTYVSNMFLEDSFQPQELNTGLLKKNIRVIPKKMRLAGILKSEGNYKVGSHCFHYLLTHEYQARFQKAFYDAVRVGEERFDVRFGPDAAESDYEQSEEDLGGIEDIINQLTLDVDVDLLACIKFLRDPTVLMYLTKYFSRLKCVGMSINVDEVHAGIRHGLQLIRTSPEGSADAARGWSYVFTGQAILDRTDGGVFRPHYILREFRVFEVGFQQYPTKYNKKDLIEDPDYVNLDQVSSHATIILQMMDKLKMEAGPLREYVSNRDGVAQRLGIEVGALKKAVNAFLNGAKAAPKSLWNRKSGEPLSCFAPFIEAYGVEDPFGSKDFTEAIDRYHSFIKWIHPLKRSVNELTIQAELVLTTPRREGTNLGYIAQIVELLHKVIYVETNKVELVGDAHDGIVVDAFGNRNLSTREANRLTGFALDYVEKPLGGSRKTRVEQDVENDQRGPFLLHAGELTAGAPRNGSRFTTLPYESRVMSHLITRTAEGARSWTSGMKTRSGGETGKPERLLKTGSPRHSFDTSLGSEQDAPPMQGWKQVISMENDECSLLGKCETGKDEEEQSSPPAPS